MFNSDEYYEDATRQMYFLAIDLLGDSIRNRYIEETNLYQLLNKSNKKREDSKFWLQIASMEIEEDKIYLFDKEYLTWGIVVLQAYKNGTDGQAVEYNDKELDLTDQ